MLHRLNRRGRLALAGIAAAALAVPALAIGQQDAGTNSTSFQLAANPGLTSLSCITQPGHTPTANVTVTRGSTNDTLTLKLAGFKAGSSFDMFTVQSSPFDAGFSGNFGLAWYQSDVSVGANGTSTTKIKTILLDQIFGFDAGSVNPTHTFHVGFWFDSAAEANGCIANPPTTPFNGEQNAGPLAFISKPNAHSHLGPLCIKHEPGTANPPCNP
jgi:hypothetical protein